MTIMFLSPFDRGRVPQGRNHDLFVPCREAPAKRNKASKRGIQGIFSVLSLRGGRQADVAIRVT